MAIPSERTIGGDDADGSAGPMQDVTDAAVNAGAAVAKRVPVMADAARGALIEAQHEVDRLSDTGVVVALGFSIGLASGLLLAGAPRLLLGLLTIPIALTLRSASGRGLRPSVLLD